MDIIPSGQRRARRARFAMISSPPRFVWLALLGLAGTVGQARAMGETPFTRSGTSAATANEDTLTWSLLGTAMLSFGMVTACGWGIRRHQRRSGAESEILDELQRKNWQDSCGPSPGTSDKASNRPSWEKSGDWWRQDFPRD